MGNDAPDERAQKLADKIMGKPPTDTSVASLIAGSVSVGQRGEDGKPIGDRISAEEYRGEQRKPNRRAAKPVDDEDDDGTADEEGGDDEEDLADEEEDDEEDEGEGVDTDEEDDEADDESEDDEEDDGEDFAEADYDDEDTLEVKVDGEVREVSLRELKRVYSLNTATEKRLKEATDARNAANAEREAVQTEVQQHRGNMLRTIQQLDGVLFAPLVDEPDPKLRTKNMQEYLLHKDAYEEDQKRIAAGRAELTTFLAGEHQKMQTARAEFRATHQKLLAEKMPDLLDPTKSERIQKDILDAATHYGFTPEMVAEVDHHGLFLMARDAARWLNMQKIKKNGNIPHDGDETSGKIKRRKRHLRPGNGTPTGTKLKLVRSQKEQRAAETQARRTGSVNDVSAMLISKARRRVNPNGRRGKDV